MPRLTGNNEQNEPAPSGPRRLGRVSSGARVGARDGMPANPAGRSKGKRLGPPPRSMRLGAPDGAVTLRGAGQAKPAARGLKPLAVSAKPPAGDTKTEGGSAAGRAAAGRAPKQAERPRGLRPLRPAPALPPGAARHRLRPPSRVLAAAALEAAAARTQQPGPIRRFVARVPWRRVAFAAASAAIALILLAAYTNLARQPHLSESDVRNLAFQAMASATPPPPRASLIYASVAPSVVQIVTDQAPSGAASGGQNGQEEHAGGTGVILDQSAHILTALHVVQDASKIQVGFADGTVSDATVVSTEPEKDIAVLGVADPPAQFVPATLGDPNSLHVGDPAVAIGNPFGLAYTTTAGIISGLNRSFKTPTTGQEMTGLIQFDAAVNPGNSGGPLVNDNGEVVGIVTALANPTDQSVFIGIGFAVPIDTAAGAAGSPPF